MFGDVRCRNCGRLVKPRVRPGSGALIGALFVGFVGIAAFSAAGLPVAAAATAAFLAALVAGAILMVKDHVRSCPICHARSL